VQRRQLRHQSVDGSVGAVPVMENEDVARYLMPEDTVLFQQTALAVGEEELVALSAHFAGKSTGRGSNRRTQPEPVASNRPLEPCRRQYLSEDDDAHRSHQPAACAGGKNKIDGDSVLKGMSMWYNQAIPLVQSACDNAVGARKVMPIRSTHVIIATVRTFLQIRN
jgi:hypothetical protein